MSLDLDNRRRLERLVEDPPSAFEADMEAAGAPESRPTRASWVIGLRRGLISVDNSNSWWQILLVRLVERRDRRRNSVTYHSMLPIGWASRDRVDGDPILHRWRRCSGNERG